MAQVVTMNGVTRTKAEDDLLRSFKPPEFIPPYAVEVNQSYSTGNLQANLHRWFLDLKMDDVLSPEMYDMIVAMDICALPARIFPDAGEWGIEFACKYAFMLWVWDDTLDCTDIGKALEMALVHILDFHLVVMWSFPDDPVLQANLQTFLGTLDALEREQKSTYIDSVLVEARLHPGTVYPGNVSGICKVFLAMWDGAVQRGSPVSSLRLAQYTQDWLLGVLLEVQTREQKKGPASIEDYIKIRKKAGAVLPLLMCTDIVYGITSPTDWFDCPDMRLMLDAANDFICWHNDIWSFKREVLVHKDIMNIVLAIGLYRNVSYQAAATITTQMLYDRITDMEKAAVELEAVTPPSCQLAFKLYLMACRNFVTGTHDWHSNNIRYR